MRGLAYPVRWMRDRALSALPVLPLLLVALLAAVPSWSCRDVGAREIGRLDSAFRSPAELGRAVVTALRKNDREALESWLVTGKEHRDLLWSSLPERNAFSFEAARELNLRNTRKAVTRALERYGGMPLEFVSITFGKEPEVYAEFTLHRGTELRVRHRETGREGTIPVLDVVLEMDGGWKPMHYVE